MKKSALITSTAQQRMEFGVKCFVNKILLFGNADGSDPKKSKWRQKGRMKAK